MNSLPTIEPETFRYRSTKTVTDRRPHKKLWCKTSENVRRNLENSLPIIQAGTIVQDYIVGKQIGEGGYGVVYTVQKSDGFCCAMKVEWKSAPKQGLKSEVSILKMLQDSTYFPYFILNGKNHDFRYFLMELLGPSLAMARKRLPNGMFGQFTLIKTAIESLEAIRQFHDRGYVHRDIKPGNFLIRPNREHPICLVDFGLAKRYVDDFGDLLLPSADPGFTGTTRYASIHAHQHEELGRRDDLISWIYMIVELADGVLPWPGGKDKEKTMYLKRTISPSTLCQSLPSVFAKILSGLLQLGFKDRPDYDGIQKKLKKAIQSGSFVDRRYDWEKLTQSEVQSISEIPLHMNDPPEEAPVDGGCAACHVA